MNYEVLYQYVEYLGQGSSCSKVIVRTHTYTADRSH